MGKYKGKFERGTQPDGAKDPVGRAAQQEKKNAAPTQKASPHRDRNEDPYGAHHEAVSKTAGKKKSRVSTPAKIALIALLVIVLLVGGVLVYANYMLNKIDRSEISGDPSLSYADLLGDVETHDVEDSQDAINNAQSSYDAVQTQENLDSGTGIVNYLIIGSDRRDTSGYGNSDSMIIMSLNKDTKKIHLTSLMRAMYVCIPKDSGDSWGMLNWSYAWGGPELLMKTIENNFKIHIDHYASVDFSSFEDVIDAIGGVSLELTSGEASYVNDETESMLRAGTQLLNGEQALSYSRCRYLDNDFKRTSRQRNVLEAVINSTTSMNVSQLSNLCNALLPAINTDMSNAAILAEAVNLGSYKNYPIDQMMLPIENQDGESYTGIMYVKGAEMYYVDLTTNLPALQNFIKD
ncbi:MAG: LCP family protein [Oscillospiraceae bacterium]|nr:LCP family protein [Oscillospiraceae bacterium]